MLYEFLKDALFRHLDETLPLIRQLEDVEIMRRPYTDGKEIGELILHMIRSLEFYMRGVAEDKWEPLAYSLEEYDTPEEIIKLAEAVFRRARGAMNIAYLRASDINTSKKKIKQFNRPATLGEIILEMLEHSIHHRGQITAYYRLLGVDPYKIEYIV